MPHSDLEKTYDLLRGVAHIPGLLYADDAPTYKLGMMMGALSASRLETGHYLEGSLNHHWNTTTALSEQVGTIEGVILISKWAQHKAPKGRPSQRTLDSWDLGLVMLALTNSAFCLEKALKTLQAIERPAWAPKRDHSLKQMWLRLSIASREDVERERDMLPPCWQSTSPSPYRTISELLDASDSVFVWGRYAPEIRGGTIRRIVDPLDLIQVAAAIHLVCLRSPGVATPLPDRWIGGSPTSQPKHDKSQSGM